VLRLEAAFRSTDPEHLPGRYWFRPSFERDRAEIAVLEMSIGELVCALGNQHHTGLGELLQASGQVRCLTNDRVLLGGAFAGQITHDNHSGGDANADL
jgi:hypothetical protein